MLRLTDILAERVIGQEEAVQLVSDAVLRARAGIQDPNRPIGSFLFLGPTGVGKKQSSQRRLHKRYLIAKSRSSVSTCLSIWKKTCCFSFNWSTSWVCWLRGRRTANRGGAS
ncbi:hypothetical protein GCM10020331_078900 [Ectobacillus funiculus]